MGPTFDPGHLIIQSLITGKKYLMELDIEKQFGRNTSTSKNSEKVSKKH